MLPRYASADFCLGNFDAVTAGVKFGRRTASGNEWSTRLEYYMQSGEAPRQQIIGNQARREQYPDLNAVIVQFGCDITSGVLRKAWRFDGGDHVPPQSEIDALLPLIGWHRLSWQSPVLLLLQPGMQLDFGGIGKEYAVDAAVALASGIARGVSCLVNFGGDVAVRHPRRDGRPWRVGVESADRPGALASMISLTRGALATSGDSRRFVLKDGKRYSHVLDAHTGWPVANAPRSVTVAAKSCTQAGTMATLALLQAADAEAFLQSQRMRFWLQ